MKIIELLESKDASYNTARQLAQELHLNIEDLTHIIASGSSVGAGNPHNVESLKRDIQNLYSEILDLGYEYTPNYSDLIRPLNT
jgi:hypothetical protein